MKISHITIFFTLLFFFFAPTVSSFELSDEAEISVLTCSPGNEIYSVYGHSAIRVVDIEYNYDIVFNYGIFDFSAPNFLYRFASGQTDYLLGAYGFSDFVQEYVTAQRSIYEQVLNLTQVEKQKIFDFLLWNAKPENRVYRYNFFFDNCATRVRDVIQQQSEGEVIFPEYDVPPRTFRKLIKEYQSKLIWVDFGIDLVVAAPSDKKAAAFDEMFLPDYLMEHFVHSTIKTGNETRPLVKSSGVIYQAQELKIKSSKITSPFAVFAALLLIVVFISVRQFRKKKINYLSDYLVFGINGFLGLAMLWFVFYSEHPAMNPNYNILWAIPLNFIFAFLWRIKKWRNVLRYYFLVVAIWLFIFVLTATFVPQKFNAVFYIISLIVLCRAFLNSVFIFRKNNI